MPACLCAEAKGVASNRLQNVVITLDKVKMVLQQPGQVGGSGRGARGEPAELCVPLDRVLLTHCLSAAASCLPS